MHVEYLGSWMPNVKACLSKAGAIREKYPNV
jgi:hypothetical protein